MMRRVVVSGVVILLMGLVVFSYGQGERELKGVVMDGFGNPIVGCSVMIKGTPTGTSTNVCGEFSIVIGEGNVTVVLFDMSYVDMRAFEIILKPKDINDEVILFQLGHWKAENKDCKMTFDKKLKKYIIE